MIKNIKEATYVHDNGTEKKLVKFNFSTNLTAYEKVKFVKTVSNTLVDSDYLSVIKDMIFNYTIIRIFTDIDLNEIENSSNSIDAIEIFLEETNIVDIVKTNVDDGLIEELENAVDLNIEYRTGVYNNKLNNSLANLLNTIEKKVNEFDMNDAVEMITKFNGITDEFTVDNIVKAYIDSDVYKKNIVEIENFKK